MSSTTSPTNAEQPSAATADVAQATGCNARPRPAVHPTADLIERALRIGLPSNFAFNLLTVRQVREAALELAYSTRPSWLPRSYGDAPSIRSFLASKSDDYVWGIFDQITDDIARMARAQRVAGLS